MSVCLECGDPLFGRSDKKFCNDGCRNTFNNKQLKETSVLIRLINAKLRKNHKLLSEIKLVDGKARVHKKKLNTEGFDFDHFTSLKVYKNGSEYRFVYDIGYKFLADEWVLIVKKEVE